MFYGLANNKTSGGALAMAQTRLTLGLVISQGVHITVLGVKAGGRVGVVSFLAEHA